MTLKVDGEIHYFSCGTGNPTTTSPPTSCVSMKDGKAVFKQRAIDWSAGIESMKGTGASI